MSDARSWIMAARPRTLALSLAPVVTGAALAFALGAPLRWGAVADAMLCAALIQIATNLHNDAADFLRGGDGPDRLGPPRVAAAGLLDAGVIDRAALACLASAALGGTYLVAVGGAPILVLGLLSLACAWLYSSGPRPIASTPFGEIFVLVFFGLGATGGAFYLAGGRFDTLALPVGAALGLFAAAALLVNNHRDRAEDARNGRRTLAIVLGPRASAPLHSALILTPFLLLAPLAARLPGAALALGALPFALRLARAFWRTEAGPGLNRLLAQTAQCEALFAALLSLGVVLFNR